MTAIARARSRGPRGRVAASPAIALSALRSLKFFFGALSANFFEFVAEFLPIPRHPGGDLQHFRRPRTVVFSSCRGQIGERRPGKVGGQNTLPAKLHEPSRFFFSFARRPTLFSVHFACEGRDCFAPCLEKNTLASSLCFFLRFVFHRF